MGLAATMRVTFDRLDLDVAFDVASGEVAALVGPSGAGKTTILRALAGLIPLRAGRVTLDGAVLEDVAAGTYVAPERRPVGVVFHDGLLFPHLSVLDNVAAGLRFRGASRAPARREARRWLARLGIEALADAPPVRLSGGQTQRVALARALAVEPRLLLLDEPLSALDVTTRADMRRELRRHLAEFPGIRLLVTHDPIEALSLADRLIVIENGRIVQSGSSLDVTQRPRSRYVADFVGVNWIRGVAHGEDVSVANGGSLSVIDPIPGDVFAVIHPRAVALYRERPHGSPRNVLGGTIVAADDEGTRVRVRVAVPFPLIAEVTRDAAADLDVERGGDVWVVIKATEITTYPA